MSKKILTLIAIIAIWTLLAMPIGVSADSGTTNTTTNQLEYSEIAGIVSAQNIQIESAQLTLDKLRDSVDKVEDSLNDVEYIPDSIDLNSIHSQLGTAEIQVQQTEALLIYTAENYFVSYNQLRYNLPIAEQGIDLLKTSVKIAEINYQYGLGDQIDVYNVNTQLAEAESNYLIMQNQMLVLLMQLKILLNIDPEATLEIGDVPEADQTYFAAINSEQDMATALTNSYTLKIKDVAATYSPSNRKVNILELEQAERDAKAAYLQNYAALGEQSVKTLLAEQKLTQAEHSLYVSQQQYNAGLISKIALLTAQNQYAATKAEAQNEEATMFWQIESYKAMIAGLLSVSTATGSAQTTGSY